MIKNVKIYGLLDIKINNFNLLINIFDLLIDSFDCLIDFNQSFDLNYIEIY